jgi:phage host-nuclease inhibitor protein Gam
MENKKGKMACSKCGAVMESKKKAKKVKESLMGMDPATQYNVMSRERLDAMAKQGDSRARQELSKRGPAPAPNLAIKPSATGVSDPYTIASDDRLRGMAARGDQQAKAEMEKRRQPRQPMQEVAPPGEKAERFIRQNKEKFRKQYGDRAEEVLYSTAWKQFGKKEESYTRNQVRLETLKKHIGSLQKTLQEHRQTWKQQLSEGTVVDPLNVGYGLEGEVVAGKIAQAQQHQRKVETWLAAYRNQGIHKLQEQVATVLQIRKLVQAKKQAPWGLAYQDQQGQQQQKFFESRANAKFWRDLNAKDIKVLQMFGPRDFDKKITKLQGTL